MSGLPKLQTESQENGDTTAVTLEPLSLAGAWRMMSL